MASRLARLTASGSSTLPMSASSTVLARHGFVDRDPSVPEMNHGVEGDEGGREIAGIGGDAGFARAEDGMVALDPADRRATGSGRSLVAGGKDRGIAEIGAARALHQIAADRR